MARKTILTCAVTGNLTTRDQHPGLPVTPREIATAALEAAAAGAAVVHLHARDPETGLGSMSLDSYREIVDRIRERNPRVILNLTTGEGGRFVPSDEEPSVAAAGTTLVHPQRRVAHVEALRPDLCTLDLNVMWSGRAVVINTPRTVGLMAERIHASGVTPELEIFDTGDLHMARHLLEKGVLRRPVIMQFVLGVRFGAMATPQTLHHLASQVPAGTVWAGFGIGRHAFPMLAQSWLLGGQVRIGMEDTVHIREGELCTGNAQLVEKAATIVDTLGGTLATPDEARAILGLPSQAVA